MGPFERDKTVEGETVGGAPSASAGSRRAKLLVVVLIVIAGIGVTIAISMRSSRGRDPETDNLDNILAEFRLQKPPPPDMGFVGSAECATCHAEIAEQFQSHPMGMATDTVAHAPVLEDFQQVEFAPPGPRRYRVEKTDAGVFHHEILLDADGKTIYDQAEQIHYAIGSGTHARTYLFNRGGLFFQSPITWYSQRNRWDLSPGYDPIGHSRFGRRITENCLRCHTGRVMSDRPSTKRFQDPPFAELAISCERCHGPGKRHVELNAVESTTEGIVNPAKLEPFKRESVCYQCHLKHLAVFPRYGRRFDDFRPGERLDDSLLVFVKAMNAHSMDSMAVTSQVAQMRVSVCFVASQGELGCISCHNPHFKPAPDEQDRFYRERCFRCHEKEEESCALPVAEQQKRPAVGSCIHCHMPSAPLSDIPHTVHTDHRIPRNAENVPSKSFPVRSDDSVVLFGQAERLLPKRELRRAYGLLYFTQATMQNDMLLLNRAQSMLLPPEHNEPDKFDVALDAIDDDVRVLAALAQIYMTQSRFQEAMACWDRVLKHEPDNEVMLEGLANIHDHGGDQQKALGFLDRLLAIHPYSEHFHERRSQYLDKLNDPTAATAAAEQALRINPTNERVREWLIDAYKRAGMNEKSEAHRDMLERIQKAFEGRRSGE